MVSCIAYTKEYREDFKEVIGLVGQQAHKH